MFMDRLISLGFLLLYLLIAISFLNGPWENFPFGRNKTNSEQLNYYLLFCLDITEVSPKKITNFVMELAPKAN